MSYWRECVEEALSEAKISATAEQISTVSSMVKNAHEMYGEAHGYLSIPNPLKEENEKLAVALKKEKEKWNCKACGGTGRIISYGPSHSGNSHCYKCNGEGKV